jgi:hypothetical protein
VSKAGIIWNRESFDTLLRATSLAIQQRQKHVEIVETTPRKGFWRNPITVKHVFTVAEATQKIHELRGEFHGADQPAQPYKEGEEGQ